jgi:TolB-like protein/Tfp pilus assembly protein PilF
VADSVETDTASFERAVDEKRPADALALYHGAFLAGLYLADLKAFESWVDRRRARLLRAYRRVRKQRIDELVAAGDHAGAVRIATHAVDIDPLDDEAQHRLIELLALTGRRADAIAHYETYTRALTNEGLQPLDETRALIERIRAGNVSGASLPVAAAPSPVPRSVDRAAPPPTRRWAILAGGAMVLVLAGALLSRLLTRSDDFSADIVAAGDDTATGVVNLDDASERKVLAVLPVENLTGKEDGQYFADGMHEAMITQLGRIRGLDVISRQSVMEYRNTPTRMRQIGEELGATVVLASSVRREGNSVRIAVRLADAASDRYVWTHEYAGTLTDVFGIQADVAQSIADTLRIYLDPVQLEMIKRPSTSNPEAYDAFLRGINYFNRGIDQANYALALQQLERATKLDPNYGQAFAVIATVHASIYQNGWDVSESRKRSAQQALDRAMSLDPHAAGFARYRYYYYIERDYKHALAIIDTMESTGMPKASADWERALILRRMGDFARSTRLMESAIRLNPRSSNWHYNLGISFAYMRQFDRALAEFKRANELAPDWDMPHVIASLVYHAQGNLQAARAQLDGLKPVPEVTYRHFQLDLAERNFDQALARTRVLPHVAASQNVYLPRSMLAGTAHRLAGRPDLARPKYEEALAILDSANKVLSDDPRIIGSLAIVHAALGHQPQARRALDAASHLIRAPNVAMGHKVNLIYAMAETSVLLYDNDVAISTLQSLLMGATYFTVEYFKLDPRWDPIRRHPRFAALGKQRT